MSKSVIHLVKNVSHDKEDVFGVESACGRLFVARYTDVAADVTCKSCRAILRINEVHR